MRRRLVAKRALTVLASVLIAWALAEVAVLTLLRHPQLLAHVPAGVRANIQALYLQLDRPIIQYDSRSARWDPELFYTLKPGEFDFHSREFSTHYSVNRLGVRDDEASLAAPEIVILGDSLAMGWGVQQDETFAQIIERTTGRRVLNAAVSSYGTVRELRMLDRIDVSRMSHLVIQYTDNDLDENLTFQAHDRLDIRDSQSFDSLVDQDRRRCRYWFGRYAAWLGVGRFLESWAHAGETHSPAEHAQAFLHALMHAGKVRLDKVEIVVVPGWSPWFSSGFDEVLKTATDLPPWVRRIKVVELPQPVQQFILDPHWTPRGQRQVAAEVLLAMAPPH